jgi:hypothetical protein
MCGTNLPIGTAVITTVALALQSFGLPYVLTGGGPSGATTTPMVDMVQVGFSTLRLGPAAAEATILLIALMLLGLIAGSLVILSGLRMEVDGSQLTDTSDRSHATAESSRSQPTEESHQRQSTDESSR